MKRIVVISGGSQGLGLATARELAGRHQVVIFGRNKKHLEAAAKEVGATAIACDVADLQQTRAALSEVTSKFGHVDYLINNAGTWVGRQLEEYSEKEIRGEIGVNLLGIIFLTKSTLPHLAASGAHIVTIVSAAAHHPAGHKTVYAASKAGAHGFVQALRRELGTRAAVSALYPVNMAEQADEKHDSYAQVAKRVAKVLADGVSADVTDGFTRSS